MVPNHYLLLAENSEVVDSAFFDAECFRHDYESERNPDRLPYVVAEQDDADTNTSGPLQFVESWWFIMLGGAVIVINAMQLYVQATSPEPTTADWVINNSCLLFYCVELVLRLVHLGDAFFKDEVFWNLTDLAVVIAGVMDQWVISPILKYEQGTVLSLPLVTIVRMCRFVRIMKVFKLMMASDLRWTELPVFDYITSGFIISSIFVMGLETDIESGYWDFIENCILMYFVFEISVRLRSQRWRFITSDDWAWNILDLTIVVCGVCDQWLVHFWVLYATGSNTGGEVGQVVLLVRMLRLLRILRLVRLVKAVQPLYVLALGVVEAMQSMFWVLVLTLVALYTFAILVTRMIGHGDFLDDEGGIPEKRALLFKDVFTSMFTLFAIMNGQEWPEVEPLLRRYPLMKVTFVIFTIFSSWALLSVMTGVVSDNMISARETQKEQDAAIDKGHLDAVEMAVRNVFVAADMNASGNITKESYYSVLEMPHYMSMLHDLAPTAEAKDLRDLFTWLDADEAGQVCFDDLLEGVRTLTVPVSGHCVLSLDKVVRKSFSRYDGSLQLVREEMARMRRRAQIRHSSLTNALYASEPEMPKPVLRTQYTAASSALFSCTSTAMSAASDNHYALGSAGSNYSFPN